MTSLVAATCRGIASVPEERSFCFFTQDQEKAMTHFFSPSFRDKKITNWNALSSEDPIWKKCLSYIASDYKIYLRFDSSSSGIAQKALDILTQLKQEKNLKRFFCEHVLTRPIQIQDRVYRFIGRMRLNTDGQYFCLVPSNISCIVEFNALTPLSLFYTPQMESAQYYAQSLLMKRQLEYIREFDLLLDGTLEEEVASLTNEPHCEKVFSALCESSILLPDSIDSIRRSIAATIRGTFTEKAKELNSSVQRKRWILGTTLVATFAIGVIAWAKPYPLNQWIDSLARRITSS